MKIKEALPNIFRRPVPVVSEGTSVLVGGTLLDTPRMDVLPIVRSSDMSLQFLSRDRRHLLAFGGYSIVSRLLERNSQDHYKFLFEPIESIALSVQPIPADEEITSLIRAFSRTKFGWAIIEDTGTYALATLADLIPLYGRGILGTHLHVRDVASGMFALPGDTKLRNVLQEMIKRWVRRIFISGTSSFVSDREILTYLFSPARLAAVRDSPREMLEAKLEEMGPVEPITVESAATLREVSALFKPVSGAWCLACSEGVVTPWDLVVKPWKLGQLMMRDGTEQIHETEKVGQNGGGFVK